MERERYFQKDNSLADTVGLLGIGFPLGFFSATKEYLAKKDLDRILSSRIARAARQSKATELKEKPSR